jgi:hypothetical protein
MTTVIFLHKPSLIAHISLLVSLCIILPTRLRDVAVVLELGGRVRVRDAEATEEGEWL